MKKIFLLIYIFHIILLQSQDIELIGYSAGGKPINVYKFGSGVDTIVIVGGFFGDDTVSNKITDYLIELLETQQFDLTDKSVVIIPEINPDGIINKERVNEKKVYIAKNFDEKEWASKYVDINKIFNAGVKPFSEPETIAFRDFILALKEEQKRLVILSIIPDTNGVDITDSSSFNKELYKIITNENIVIHTKKNLNNNINRWLFEKCRIASISIDMSLDINRTMNNLKKSLENLLVIDFKEKIYNSNLLDIFLGNSNDETNIFEVLPDNVKNKLKTKKEKKSFLTYLKNADEDKELLLLVNKKHHLSSDYIPDDLVTITEEFPNNKGTIQLRKIIMDDLYNMFFDSKNEGVNLMIISAYRSYETQKNVYSYWVKALGEKQANRVSAIPGASQHQLGTAIDFNILEKNFINTKEGEWLSKNAYKYGFVISYPEGLENKTGYSYEPWHYRYIGKEAATIVYQYFDNILEDFLNWYWFYSL